MRRGNAASATRPSGRDPFPLSFPLEKNENRTILGLWFRDKEIGGSPTLTDRYHVVYWQVTNDSVGVTMLRLLCVYEDIELVKASEISFRWDVIAL